jgi:aspartate-semialdehyde dehydrogenase
LKSYRIAIVGAVGLVGQELVKILLQRDFPMRSLRLLSSDHTAGRKLIVRHEEIELEEVASDSFKGVDIAFFCSGSEVSRYFVPHALHSGAVVIDNSAAYRLEQNIPLAVPEVNVGDIEGHKGLVATPNSTTIMLAVALAPLHRVNPIKRVVLATYQSVSGTNALAIEELNTEAKQVLEGEAAIPHVYPHQIAFNVLPEIDVFLDDGYTKEEWKIVKETQKVMHAPDTAISVTCVRVPVFTGHSCAVHVEFTHPIFPEDAERILVEALGLKIQDDPTISLYPHPWAVAGSDDVCVGRIRKDISHPNGLVMWLVIDNVRKGAALNAVQIVEEMIKRDWLSPRR